MKKTLISIATIFGITALWSVNAFADSPKFNGTDYSGVYACKGSNAKVGNYELTVTFQLNRNNSNGNIGNYNLSVQTENSTVYTGQAIVKGNDMALTIKFTDGNKPTFSTGLAKFKRVYIEDKRFSYLNEYYESGPASNNADSKLDNFGSEECLQKSANP
jgi:hypothetical protein